VKIVKYEDDDGAKLGGVKGKVRVEIVRIGTIAAVMRPEGE
jgi:hypothetical protein